MRTYKGPLHGLIVMVKTDGLRSVQAGLGPAMIYQFVMNGLRLGTYAILDRRGMTRDNDQQLSLIRSVLNSGLVYTSKIN